MKLNSDTLSKSFAPVPRGFANAMGRAFTEIQLDAVKMPPKRYAHRLSFATALILVLLAVAISVAAMILGGVLHFNDDYVTDHESAVLPSAKTLVQTDVAHFDFGQVTMDIEEAVYDGQELRIVYALSDPSVAEAYPDNPWQTIEEMTGLESDGVWYNCDGVDINGQEVSWDDERVSGTEIPGRVLFYKRITLENWGVMPPTGNFTVRLYARKGVPINEQPSFAMNGSIAVQFTKTGTAQPFQKNGFTVELVKASFTPLRGMLSLRFTLEGAVNGDETRAVAEGWLGAGSAHLPDGTVLTGYPDGGFDPDNPVMEALLFLDPPAGEEWPAVITLQSQTGDQMEVHIQ